MFFVGSTSCWVGPSHDVSDEFCAREAHWALVRKILSTKMGPGNYGYFSVEPKVGPRGPSEKSKMG